MPAEAALYACVEVGGGRRTDGSLRMPMEADEYLRMPVRGDGSLCMPIGEMDL